MMHDFMTRQKSSEELLHDQSMLKNIFSDVMGMVGGIDQDVSEGVSVLSSFPIPTFLPTPGGKFHSSTPSRKPWLRMSFPELCFPFPFTSERTEDVKSSSSAWVSLEMFMADFTTKLLHILDITSYPLVITGGVV